MEETQNVPHRLRLEDGFPCDGSHAPIGQRAGYDGHGLAGDLHTAALVPEVQAVLYVGPRGEGVVLLQLVGQGVVPVRVFPLRQEDAVVEPNLLAARHAGEVVEDVVKLGRVGKLRLDEFLHQGDGEDGAGGDEGVVWLVVVVQLHVIELPARGLHPNIAVNNVPAKLI